jgi:hypothetical protein
MKIVTSHPYPSIPWRNFDWCAHADGDEEAGEYGWGASEKEAIADYLESHDLIQCGRCDEILESDCEPDGCEDPDCPVLGL